jgi:hypothetical protein
MCVKATVNPTQPLSRGKSQDTSHEDLGLCCGVGRRATSQIIRGLISARLVAGVATLLMMQAQVFERSSNEQKQDAVKVAFSEFNNHVEASLNVLEDINNRLEHNSFLMQERSALSKQYVQNTGIFLAVRQTLAGRMNVDVFDTQLAGFNALLTQKGRVEEPMVADPKQTNLLFNFKGYAEGQAGLDNLKYNIVAYNNAVAQATQVYNLHTKGNVVATSVAQLLQKIELVVNGSDVTSSANSVKVPELPNMIKLEKTVNTPTPASDLVMKYVVAFAGILLVSAFAALLISASNIETFKASLRKNFHKQINEIRETISSLTEDLLSAQEKINNLIKKHESSEKKTPWDVLQTLTEIVQVLNNSKKDVEQTIETKEEQLEDLNHKVQLAAAFAETKSFREVFATMIDETKELKALEAQLEEAKTDLEAAKNAEKNHDQEGMAKDYAFKVEKLKQKIKAKKKEVALSKKKAKSFYSEKKQEELRDFFKLCEEQNINDSSLAILNRKVKDLESQLELHYTSIEKTNLIISEKEAHIEYIKEKFEDMLDEESADAEELQSLLEVFKEKKEYYNEIKALLVECRTVKNTEFFNSSDMNKLVTKVKVLALETKQKLNSIKSAKLSKAK